MTMTSTSDPLVGRLLDGRYEILERVARGGMATVYRAHDQRLTRVVAVKVMHDGLGDDAEFARKFDREARAAARLSNQHVVSVFDQGIDRGRPYIVMEFVEGCTLRHVITREGPLEPLRALDLMEPVVHALASAHESDLVHRDVKPENVMISHRGQIKVGDFGLARAVTAHTATATQGLLIGTVSYIPPELVTSGRANKRSDVYSAGIVLFELLTGQKPHKGETPIQVAWSHVHNDVPAPSTLVHADGGWRRDSRRIVPPYLDALVLACTRRQPAMRPADGRELLALLRRARQALSHGVMDDPALTERMRASTRPSEDDLEATAPTPAPPGAIHADVEAVIAPPEPVSFRLRSPSSPISSRTGPLGRLRGASAGDTRSMVATPPGGRSRRRRVSVSDDHGAPSVRMRATTPTSPVDLPARANGEGRVLWSHVEGPTGPSAGDAGRRTGAALDTPVPRPAGRPSGSSRVEGSGGQPPRAHARSSRPRSQSTPIFPHVSHDPVHQRRRGLVALVLVLLLALVAGLSTYWYVAEGRWTSAPHLEAQTEQQARQAAAAQGFGVAATDAYSEDVPAGTVISTDPVAGSRVLKKSTLTVVISKGPERHQVPDLGGLTLEDARQRLVDAHLRVGKVTQSFHARVPSGTLVSWSRTTGTPLKPNTPVDLVVSKGPQPIAVPDQAGRALSQARNTLTKLGFAVTTTEKNHATVPRGHVISQDPSGGSRKAGDTIALVVSRGPVMVSVPTVAGADEATARARLTGAGFRVKVVYNTDAKMRLNVVAMQAPGARGSAPQGSTVTIYIS